MTRTRRSLLASVGTLATLFSGCLGGSSTPSTDAPTTDTETARSETTSTGTSAPETVRLDPTSPPGADATALVYPTDLRRWLREAATTEETLRVHAETNVPAPKPPLPTFDRVRLTGASDELDGWYATDVDGGIRYQYLAGAEAVTPPDGATVTPVSELRDERRRLVTAAIDGDTGDSARFYPETALGAWARTDFFGGYVRQNGTTYRGHERQQTDAAFFSRQCWYVISATSAQSGPAPTLSLATIDGDVRRVIDGMLSERNPHESVTRDATDLPESVVRFAEDVDHLLTHSVTFAVSVG